MRKNGLLLLLLFGCWTALPAQGSQKIALLIGVSTYPTTSGWQQLHAAQDLQLLEEALQRQGFLKENILLLQDAAATKAGIEKAISQNLLNRVHSGDLVYLHFSGHGQQVRDDNGDEQDGFDEAWVPYDSPQAYQAGVYEGERLLRDDELAYWLKPLRQKLGAEGQVLLTVDACHSGTGTRGQALARGTDRKMAPRDYQPAAESTPEERQQLTTDLSNETEQAPLIAIFAAAANELNYEYIDPQGMACGSLSYAISKVLAGMPSNPSYRGFFDHIRREMIAVAPRQTPQIEGNLDYAVFRGLTRPLPQHLTVLRRLDPQTLLLDGGTLLNIYPGTTLRIYPIDTYNPETTQPLATGQITASLPLIAELKLEAPLQQAVILGAWAFIETQHFGPLKIKLDCALQLTPLRKQILMDLERYVGIEVVEGPADLRLEEAPDGTVQLLTKEGMMLEHFSGKTAYLKTLKDKIIRRMLTYAQAAYLRGLEMQNTALQLELEIIPVEVTAKDGRFEIVQQLSLADRMGPDGILRFEESESFILQVTNKGQLPAYYAVIDIWADNQLVSLIPNAACPQKRSDYFIRPGETHLLESCIIDLYPPYGNEMLKLIATEQPFDLEQLINTRGEAAGTSNPFEVLFHSTFEAGALRGGMPGIPPSAAHIDSVVFRIVPKQ
ncbi:MAG: caspase family protein [Phaeodactylibacter sp.]|nr:caspase family protein [Phaeodactylibacter sp.]